MFIRIFGYRIAQVRNLSFKRPPPDYMFKRPVVPSDLQIPPKKHKFDIENDKWCDDDEKSKNDDSQDNTYDDKQD